MRVAIVGSREYPRLDLVRAYVRTLKPGDVVVSGNARGVDRTAEEAARERGLEVVSIPADWGQGRGAGFMRNHEIVRGCDRLVAFWDGQSRGTMHSVSLAQKAGIPFRVVGRDGEVVLRPDAASGGDA